jgi:hypothetical protein
MTETQQFFLEILSDYINGKETFCNYDVIDWSQLKKYADMHQITAIIYKQCKSIVPKDIGFSNALAFQAYNYTNRQNAIEILKDKLQQYEYVFVKGLEIAKLYPDPVLRTMGDSDLLVHTEDKEQIHKLLLELGYQFFAYHEEEWKYQKGPVQIELHDQLLHIAPDDEKSTEYFGNVWQYVDNNKLNWNYHCIYLLKHLSRHLKSGGVGFRQFMDIAVVTNSPQLNLDWTWIKGQLTEINLLAFAKHVFAFNYRCFGVKSPIEIERMDDKFFEMAVDNIFRNGVFGHDNASEHVNFVSGNEILESDSLSKIRFLYIIKALFPSYKEMIRYPQCNYLKKIPFLLPVAWIWRLFYKVIGKHANTLFKDMLIAEQNIEKKKIILQGWFE